MTATWVVKGNLKGPKGDKGETGKSVRSSNIDIQSNATVPLANIKPNTNVAVGDTIFDVNGEVFTVTAVTDAGATVGTALSGVSMKGPKGDRGETGPQGVQGVRGEAGERGPQGVQGQQGVRGETGPAGADGAKGADGAAAGFGAPTATVDSNVGTPAVTVTATGGNTSKVFNFAFKNLKGASGTRGSKWFVGTGTPTATDAIAGDQYLDTATGNVYTFA